MKKICDNCEWSEIRSDGEFGKFATCWMVCMAMRGCPAVSPTDTCEWWHMKRGGDEGAKN